MILYNFRNYYELFSYFQNSLLKREKRILNVIKYTLHTENSQPKITFVNCSSNIKLNYCFTEYITKNYTPCQTFNKAAHASIAS